MLQKFYGLEKISTGRIIDNLQTQQAAWDLLRTSFNFQNLSEEDLAFVYENTLVTEEARQVHGIHATPSVVAELVVKHLPFEDLPQDERFVLEPCAGHGVFLVAALRRLRDLLPASWSAEERHVYLRRSLQAIERDTFAGEVCRLSLTLADYPNPDGWKIVESDIFRTETLEYALPNSRIVLCNPPFEDFNEQERNQYGKRIQSVHKPYEILRRVLERPPAMFGFVLPKSAIIGGRYNDLQRRIADHYTNIETVALPDRVFAFSDQETMLFMASRPDPAMDAKIYTKTSWVRERDRTPFLETGYLPDVLGRTDLRKAILKAHKDLWNPPLWEVWEYLSENPRLGEVAEIHRGIEWNVQVKLNKDALISGELKPGYKKGIDKISRKLEPFWAEDFVYLNMDEKYRRTNAHTLPWKKPKVMINGNALMRSPWRLVGFPDKTGLICFQNLIGIWLKHNISIEVVAALINSPLANFAVYINEGKRRNRISTIERIPIPSLDRIDSKKTGKLVNEYQRIRARYKAESPQELIESECIDRLLTIDSLVLKAYDLPPRLERKLLDFFNGYPRPVPFPFPDYFPSEFKPCIPLHQYLEMDMKEASAKELSKKIEPIDSQVIHQFVLDLEERQG